MSTLITMAMPPDPLADLNDNAVEKLTENQRIVCALMARGLSSKVIAVRLDVALRTVEFRRTQSAKVLGLETGHLILWAARNIERLPDTMPAVVQKQRLTGNSSPAANSVEPRLARPVMQFHPRSADPTPEEIAERASAIRSEWAAGYPSIEDGESADERRGVLCGV